MSGFKGIAKGGWHPGGKGEGGKESWRGDFKGINTVSGWKNKAMGKSGDGGREDAHAHVSAPLSTLKDPSSFGPPPKHRAYYGDAAGPARPRATREQEAAHQAEESGPPAIEHSTKPKPKPKPSLPPRLPPRQNSQPDAYAPAPPPTYNEATQDGSVLRGELNQGALGRLGRAGISVPGLEIGRNASPPLPPRQTAGPWTATGSPAPTGTTWAEKQAALKTANQMQADPSKVSLSDARTAASTANNFRQRHGEQVAAGWRSASNLNQKYGITGRVEGLAGGSGERGAGSTAGEAVGGEGRSAAGSGVLGKKAPPPPPPKKRELVSPPPVPLGSKPKF